MLLNDIKYNPQYNKPVFFLNTRGTLTCIQREIRPLFPVLFSAQDVDLNSAGAYLYSGRRLKKTRTHTYRVSQEEWTKLRESVPYVELYQYNPKHLYPKFNGYGDNGQRSLKL